MGAPLPFQRLVRRSDLPDDGCELHVQATTDECRDLARALDLSAIEDFSADMRITPHRDGLHASGHFTCRLTYLCVRSLEPFVACVEETVEGLFLPELSDEGEAGELELSPDDEPPELLTGEGADIGFMLAQALSLAIDPYPRKPGADLVAATTPQPSLSPFAVLSTLKDGKEH